MKIAYRGHWVLVHALAWWGAWAASADPPRDRPFLTLDPEPLAHEIARVVFANYPRETAHHVPTVPRLLTTLSIGESFSLPDDPARAALRRWMLTQPDRSIWPHALLTKAIEIRGGAVFPALLLCWDVLRERWTWLHRRNFFPHILKLADLTGEAAHYHGPYSAFSEGGRAPFETGRGDVFSGTYHFFGTAIDAFYMEWRWGEFVPGHWRPRFLLALQRWRGNHTFGNDEKRHELDLAGVYFGYLLARYLKVPTLRGSLPGEELPGAYLRDAPDRYPGLRALREGQTEEAQLAQAAGRGAYLDRLPNLPLAEAIRRIDAEPPDADRVRAWLRDYDGLASPQRSEVTEFAVYESPVQIAHARAIESLALRGDGAAITLLAEILAGVSPAPYVEAALVAVARSDRPRFCTLAEARVRDSRPLVRLGIVRGLEIAGRGDESVVDTLLRDAAPLVQEEIAALVLGEVRFQTAERRRRAYAIVRARTAKRRALAWPSLSEWVGWALWRPFVPLADFLPGRCGQALSEPPIDDTDG